MYDIMILGAGAAGLTAAVYASRAGRSAVVIERAYPGGQFVTTTEIQNMPGFVNVSGYDLAQSMLKQAEAAGAEFVYDNPIVYDFQPEIKRVTLESGNVISARGVIIAVGAQAKPLGVPNEERFIGRGVHYCATCDGGFYKDKTVAVIGGGNTAVADAIYLSRLAKKVYLIHRRDTLRAKGAEAERLNSLKNIEILYNTVAEGIIAEKNKLSGLALKSTVSDEKNNLELDGVFVAIGNKPNTEPLKETGIAMNEYGYIITDENKMTNIPCVMAAGDVIVKDLRQIVTASADGAIAAEALDKMLN